MIDPSASRTKTIVWALPPRPMNSASNSASAGGVTSKLGRGGGGWSKLGSTDSAGGATASASVGRAGGGVGGGTGTTGVGS